MRCLLVFCHPGENSFGAAILHTARTALAGAGHELRVIDLYREGFDPVLSPEEWQSYHADTAQNIAALQEHVDALRWAESLVLVFPTWMYGPPAMLKGWLERVWLPGVAFDLPQAGQRLTVGKFRHIRRLTVITTSGSPWWWLARIGNPCRGMIARGFRPLFHRRCRVRWLQLYDMNHGTDRRRRSFLQRVATVLAEGGA